MSKPDWRTLLLSGLPVNVFWPRPRTPLPFVQKVAGSDTLRAVDLGARGDVPPPWLVLDGVAEILAFEPDPKAAADLAQTYASRGNADRYRIFPFGVTGTGGTRDLFYFDTASGASVLEFTGPLWEQYCSETAAQQRTTIDTRRLDDVLDEAEVDGFSIIKLDIQGPELEVLMSLSPRRMADVVCIETEVFVPKDGLRPRFVDFDAYLTPLGFELFDVRAHRAPLVRERRPFGYHTELFKVASRSRSISQRLFEFDMIYFRSAEQVLATGSPRQVRHLALALCTYNYFAEAYFLIERAEKAGYLGSDGQAIRDAIVEWHRRLRRRWIEGNGRVPRFFYNLCKYARAGDALRWGRSQWLGEPSS